MTDLAQWLVVGMAVLAAAVVLVRKLLRSAKGGCDSCSGCPARPESGEVECSGCGCGPRSP